MIDWPTVWNALLKGGVDIIVGIVSGIITFLFLRKSDREKQKREWEHNLEVKTEERTRQGILKGLDDPIAEKERLLKVRKFYNEVGWEEQMEHGMEKHAPRNIISWVIIFPILILAIIIYAFFQSMQQGVIAIGILLLTGSAIYVIRKIVINFF